MQDRLKVQLKQILPPRSDHFITALLVRRTQKLPALRCFETTSFLRSTHQPKEDSNTDQQEENGGQRYLSIHHITRLASGKYSPINKLTSLTFSAEKSGGALKKCKTFVGEKMPSTS